MARVPIATRQAVHSLPGRIVQRLAVVALALGTAGVVTACNGASEAATTDKDSAAATAVT